jgi:hypothetical protein
MHSQQLKISCIEQLLFEMNLFSSYAFKIRNIYNKTIFIFFLFYFVDNYLINHY